jgi:epoxyqueuosine reductase
MNVAEQIKLRAFELGFDLVGITDASAIDYEHVNFFSHWLRAGYAGQMNYMHKNFEKRINPCKLLKGAKSIVVVGLNFKPPERKQKKRHVNAPVGRVTVYARYQDYHSYINRQLHNLIDFINSHICENHKFKVCVDSAPLAERALAARAGLGFIGKNHMLINPTLGPQIFLGEIVTTLELQPDNPIIADDKQASQVTNTVTCLCSNCSACIEACPTGALRPDGQFDATRCINYLTIEHKGKIPVELAVKISDRLFGCDKCILACPYQKNAPVCKNSHFKLYRDRAELDLHHILVLTQDDFDTEFADSPIQRAGLENLKRNARICLANVTHQKS